MWISTVITKAINKGKFDDLAYIKGIIVKIIHQNGTQRLGLAGFGFWQNCLLMAFQMGCENQSMTFSVMSLNGGAVESLVLLTTLY